MCRDAPQIRIVAYTSAYPRGHSSRMPSKITTIGIVLHVACRSSRTV